MTVRSSRWPAGTPCWVDLAVDDFDAARAFYAAVLGWQYTEPHPQSGYVLATVDGHAAAGLGPRQSPHQPTTWLLYFASDDAAATAKSIEANGGSVFVGPHDAEGDGTLVVAADPTGARFAVWQAARHIGAEHVNAPGGLTWEDLRSSDPDASRDFYAAVFGLAYETVEMAPDTYRTVHLPGDPAPVGGMGPFFGPPTEPHWVIYFAVEDADAAVVAVRSAGGFVTTEAIETPFGRMAGVRDPFGAEFTVITSSGAQPDRAG